MTNRGLKFRILNENEFDGTDETKGAPLQTGSLFQRIREEKSVSVPETNKTCTVNTTDADSTKTASCKRDRYVELDVNVTTGLNSTTSDQSGNLSSTGEDSAKEITTMRRGGTFTESFSYLKDTIHYESPPKQVSKVGTEDTAQKYRSNSIIVNPRQRGNPILKHIKNVPWEYGDIIPDYVLGQTQCALFLSLRYYNFNQEYIHERLKQLGNRYDLRVILVLVDIKDCKHALKELGKIAILSECTLILSWSPEEAGRYLETYKAYENKPPDVIQERVDGDYLSKMTDCLTSVKSVNKTDVITLMSAFGSLEKMTHASKDELALCPGFGRQKAERLHRLFREPFKKRKRKSDPSEND